MAFQSITLKKSLYLVNKILTSRSVKISPIVEILKKRRNLCAPEITIV
jgi:hypothetical protein